MKRINGSFLMRILCVSLFLMLGSLWYTLPMESAQLPLSEKNAERVASVFDHQEYTENDSMLFFAVAEGRLELMKQLLKEGAHVDVRDVHGCTPLIVAARNQDIASMALLLQAGACIDARDKENNTALHWAAWYRAVASVAFLVLAGADINVQNNTRLSPLMIAVYRYYRQPGFYQISRYYWIVQLLLGAKADINLKGNRSTDYTALHLAVHYGGTEMVKLLLQGSADIDAVSSTGWTPLMVAESSGRDAHESKKRAQCAILLREHAEYQKQESKRGNTRIRKLNNANTGKIISLLLKGSKLLSMTQLVQSRDAIEEVMRIFQALYGQKEKYREEVDIVQQLLKKNATITVRDSEGNSPLMRAVEANNQPLVEILLDAKADIEAKNNKGDTPLMEAVRKGHRECVLLLIKQGSHKK